MTIGITTLLEDTVIVVADGRIMQELKDTIGGTIRYAIIQRNQPYEILVFQDPA